MEVNGTELVISRDELVWVLGENRINAPMSRESPEQRAERIKAHGKEIKAAFTYRIEARWSEDRIEQVKSDNSRIHESLANLDEELGIAHLRNRHLSSKGGDFFDAKTPEEKRQVAAYEKEKRERKAQIHKLPDCTTVSYSLFLLSETGREDSMSIVHPQEASQEAHELGERIRVLCQ